MFCKLSCKQRHDQYKNRLQYCYKKLICKYFYIFFINVFFFFFRFYIRCVSEQMQRRARILWKMCIFQIISLNKTGKVISGNEIMRFLALLCVCFDTHLIWKSKYIFKIFIKIHICIYILKKNIVYSKVCEV